MKIKKLLIFLGILLMPFTVGAANDVTLTTSTFINVAGVNLNVSGSSAVVDSITVSDSGFSFVLSSGSSIEVTSSNGRELSTNAASTYIVTNACDSNNKYVLKHASTALTVTVTVTPLSTSCSNSIGGSSSSGSSSGSGRGGGGGVVLPITPATPTPALPALTAAASQATFNRGLSAGSTGDDVRNLQARLLSEGFFRGEVTGYFGPITQAAVKAYQAKYGISQLGIVGPATRAQLNKLVTANTGSNAASTSQLTPAQVSAITLQINALLKQVQELQAKLKALGN